MSNKIEYWENRNLRSNIDTELFLKNHKARLEVLLAVDVTNLPEQAKKQHQAKVNYITAIIEMVGDMREIVIGTAKAYRDNLLTPEQKLNIMEAANPKLSLLIEKLDLTLIN